MNKIEHIPMPLKAVVWLNIFFGILILIVAVSFSRSQPASQTVADFISIALHGLTILGILQASKLIRAIVLILSLLSVAILGVGLTNALFAQDVRAFILLIPFTINCITIWGLCAAPSVAYFYEDNNLQKKKEERKRIEDYIQVGMGEHEAREALAPYFLKVSEESITDSDYGVCNVLKYSDMRLSADLWLVYIVEGVVRAYK